MKYVPKGPKRYAHQIRGLKRIIEQRGIAALLFDPGTGKTMTTLDYISLLGLKARSREVRVLVLAPRAAVDTWVVQSEQYLSDDLNVWAEALGGSIIEKAHSIADRGGSPFRDVGKKYSRKALAGALNASKALALYTRGDRPLHHLEGPQALGVQKPKVILLSCNLDTFSRRDRYKSGTYADLLVEAVRRFSPDLIVIDESHKIKSYNSNVSRLVARLESLTPRRIILTGTVMPHSAMDVFAQWRFLAPNDFGRLDANGNRMRATYTDFRNKFGVMGGYMGRQIVAFTNLEELQEIMAKRAIVVRKQDALDLPPVTYTVVPVDLSAKEKAAYKAMKKDLVVQLGNDVAMVQNRLTVMMRLRQITSGYLPDSAGNVHQIGTSKLDTIKSLVNDTLEGENRVVVFCQFTHEIDELSKRLAHPGTEVLTIQGSTKDSERIAIRKRFGSQDPTRLILVAQVKTLSVAVNELITASHVVFGSMSLQRDDYIQAVDRLNRLGQTKPVTVWHVNAPRTVDDVIMTSHKERTDLEAAVLAHIYNTDD